MLIVVLPGYETARSLAMFGAVVVLACRNLKSAEECKQRIMTEKETAKVEVMHLDLNSLKSVQLFAQQYIHKQW